MTDSKPPEKEQPSPQQTSTEPTSTNDWTFSEEVSGFILSNN